MTISANLVFNAKKFDRAIVTDIFETLESLTDAWWIDHGTLLGLTRNNDFIPWDTDLDIGLWNNGPLKPKTLLSVLSKKYKYIYHDKICNCVKIKLIDNKVPWSIDIVFYHTERDNAVKYWPNFDACTPLQKRLETLRSILDGNTAPTYSNPIKCILISAIHRIAKNIPRTLKTNIEKYLEKRIPTKENTVPLTLLSSTMEKDVCGFKVRIPSSTNDYLQYRYGEDWMTPKSNWNYLRDDGGLNSTSNMVS